MDKVILLKCGEMVLKGLNRSTFEQRLLANIRHRLKAFGAFKVNSAQSTIYITPEGAGGDITGAFGAMKLVFGVASVCLAAQCGKDMAEITAAARETLADKLSAAKTFKVEARRSDKRFPLTSPEIAAALGGELLDAYPNLRVDVIAPELRVWAEIRDFGAYVHAGPEPGSGGMPVGVGGKATLLLSGGIDSPVAGYMLAKRGAELEAVHFFSYPYTSERSKRKVAELADIMQSRCGRIRLLVVPFTKIQEEIRDRCPGDLFTIIMRRFMMRIAERIARAGGSGALITGESLGQVASQTMEAIAATDAVAGIPVFRPLIGMDKDEIVAIARRIGTFETSIQPYEDCCTIFTPKHPRIKPKLASVTEAEAALDIESLVSAAVAETEEYKPE